MPNPSVSCKHEGCEKPSDGGKGYCARHYAAWKRGRLPKARYKSCRVEGCRKPVTGRGRCAEHFARDYPGKQAAATGETPTPAPRRSDARGRKHDAREARFRRCAQRPN